MSAEVNFKHFPLPDFDENRKPATDELSGKSFSLLFDDGKQETYDFKTGSLFTKTIQFEGKSEKNDVPYEAIAVRPNIYLIDVFSSDFIPRSTTALFNTASGQLFEATSVLVGKPDQWERVENFYRQAVVAGSNAKYFQPSDDLVGKRVQWTYSHVSSYEHIYLNNKRFCWHELTGPTADNADVEETVTYYIDKDLYLFSWAEHCWIQGYVFALDLQAMRNTGRAFGYDPDVDKIIHMLVGGIGTKLNTTTYNL